MLRERGRRSRARARVFPLAQPESAPARPYAAGLFYTLSGSARSSYSSSMPTRPRDWPRPPARLTIAQLDEDARRPLSPRGQAMKREHDERQRLRARAQAEGLDLSPCPELPRPLGSRTWDDLGCEESISRLRAWLAEGLAKANAPWLSEHINAEGRP